jgi:hypothetical protein
MSRRFVTLLERTTIIRRLIEREERSPKPNAVRLIRLKKLQLWLSERLRAMSAKQLIAMASAPRLKPEIVFRNVRSAPAFARGW